MIHSRWRLFPFGFVAIVAGGVFVLVWQGRDAGWNLVWAVPMLVLVLWVAVAFMAEWLDEN